MHEKEREMSKEERMFNSVMGTSVEKEFTHVTIERTGNKLILPEGMSYDAGIDWLKRQKESEETVISVSYKIKAFPIDGAYALFCAIKDIFGFALVVGKKSPSGNNPPEMIDVKLPNNEIVRVPWGRIDLPGFDEDSFVRTNYESSTLSFVINGQIRKKFEPMFNLITKRVEELLKHESLYKGRAIKLDLSFMENGNDPVDPEFIDISGVTRDSILLTDVVKRDFSSVLLRIEKTEKCIANNIPLKHGCLLAGPYGTGKTMLSRWTARVATDNGWTYLYITNARHLAYAMKIAALYAPSVIFLEDIDKATEGERSIEMNDILNTFDGIDTKDKAIITIMTTNKLDNINKAFLRAGRIDSLIMMGAIDASNSSQFITRFVVDRAGKSLLDPDADYTIAAEALIGIVPAFVAEIINKAKMYAMSADHEGDYITPEDMVVATKSFKSHIAATTDTAPVTPANNLADSMFNVVKALGEIAEEKGSEISITA